MLKMVNYPNFEHTITPHFLKLPFRRREASFILTYFHVSKLDSVLLNPLLLFYFLYFYQLHLRIQVGGYLPHSLMT